jgi:DNA primase
MSVVDEIKSRLDIVDYVQRTVPLKKAGRYYKAPCPFHSERTPSFVVNQDTQSWRCFGACAEGGDVFSFAMKQNGWTFSEAMTELGKLVGIETTQQTPEQKTQNEQVDRLRGLLKTIADAYHDKLFDAKDPQAVAALNYARTKRGLTDETLKKFGVGFAPPGWHFALEYLTHLGYSEDDVLEAGVATKNDAGRVYDRFRNRLVIPIRDERGRVVGFGGRVLDPNDNPKYLNSPQTPVFDKSRILFALDVAGRSIRDSETAVIVEGYMDAIQAHQAGFTNVVAQMGTAMTEAQLKRLAPRWAKKIVLALDADAAGQSATLRGLEVARETLKADFSGRLSVDIRILSIPDAKDPDDLIRETPERWAELVSNATPVADYVIGVEVGSLPPNASLMEREEVARRVLPILVASENDLYKRDNVQKLALKLRIQERDLLHWADEQQALLRAKPPRPATPQPPPATVDGEPPDVPFDMEGWEPPPEEDEDGTVAVAKPARPVAPPASPEAELEKYCLRMLFQQRDLFYHVNRKLRELSGGDERLADGPLSELGPEDFTRSDYRGLMVLFCAGMAQDDVDLDEYARVNADTLRPVLDDLLVEEIEILPSRLGNRMLADLTVTLKQTARSMGSTDPNVELTEKALRLRLRRLHREEQEIAYMQMEAFFPEGESGAVDLQRRIMLSSRGRMLIDRELKRQTLLSKQF